MGQTGSEMAGDVMGRTTGGFQIRKILNVEILRVADAAVSMKAVSRHDCTLMI